MGRIEKLSLYRTGTNFGLLHNKSKNKIAAVKTNETTKKTFFALNGAWADEAEGPSGKKAHFEEPNNGNQIGLPLKDADLIIDLCSSSEENDATAASNLMNDLSLSQQEKTKKLTTKKKFRNGWSFNNGNHLDQYHQGHIPVGIEWNLLHLCGQPSLEGVEADRLRQLAMDSTVGINCCNRITHDTPLMLLCRSNKSDSLLPSLKVLLQRRDLNLILRNHNAHSPLTLICRFNQHHSLIDCISLLVSRGFDLTVKDCYERNALQLLCEFYKGDNLIDIAKLFISEKMDAVDLKKAIKILHERRFRRELAQLVKPLINRPIRECNEKEKELLQLCENLKKTKRFRELALDSTVDINCVQDSFGLSPLLVLCASSNSDNLWKYVRILLKRKDLQINLRDKRSSNALHTVCYHYGGQNLLPVIRQLLKRGIHIKAQNQFGCDALLSLLRNPNAQLSNLPEITELLLDEGLKINTRARVGPNYLTTLVSLARHKNNHFKEILTTMEMLIKRGIRIDQKDNKGKNGLLLACEKIHPKKGMLLDVVHLLTRSGIDTTARDSQGLSALEIVKKRGLSEDDVEAVRVCLIKYSHHQ